MCIVVIIYGWGKKSQLEPLKWLNELEGWIHDQSDKAYNEI